MIHRLPTIANVRPVRLVYIGDVVVLCLCTVAVFFLVRQEWIPVVLVFDPRIVYIFCAFGTGAGWAVVRRTTTITSE